MTVNVFLYVGGILFAAYLAKYLTAKIGIPEVTGYVVIGVILGMSVSGFLDERTLQSFHPLSSVALAIISFIIGSELRFSSIRKLGVSILFIVIFEGVGAFAAVFCALFFGMNSPLELSLLLASVAAATAPAATVAVIRQYKAKGPLTSTILAVVGLDDAMALMIFVFVSGFVQATLTGANPGMASVLATAALGIVEALALGIAAALVFALVLRKIRGNDWVEVLLAAFLTLLLGATETFGISELLAIMAFGATVTNLAPGLSRHSSTVVEWFSPVFLAFFFILGGAHLDVRVFREVGVLGGVFFLARSAGKILGASFGAVIGRAQKVVRRYIGMALLPQVGVALALALSIKTTFDVPRFGIQGHRLATVVINILLFTTILTEIVGPLLTRRALRRAGEA